MKYTIVCRIYPTKEQAQVIATTLNECRKLYNYFLDERKTKYHEKKESVSYYDQQNELPILKLSNSILKKIPSQTLQDVAKRLDLAFKKFLSKEAEFPKFKNKYHYSSYTIPQLDESRNFKQQGYIYLPKLGNVKLKIHQEFEKSNAKSVIIKRVQGKYYACITIEEQDTQIIDIQDVANDKMIGIDLGISSLVTLSNGEKFENPRSLKNSENKLKKTQKRLSKKKKGSNKRHNQKVKLNRVHVKIKNQRKDYIYKLVVLLVKLYDIIALEDLQAKNMMKNHKLAKSIADASWSSFIIYLMYKAQRGGKIVIKVDPRDTSKLCSSCGQIVEKDLSVRLHECTNCGLILDRDENAAKNILQRGLKQLNIA